MKRVFSAMLAVVLSLSVLMTSVFSMTASAAGKGKITISSAQAKSGQSVNITISMTTNPGMATADFEILFDSSVLTLTNVKDEGFIASNDTQYAGPAHSDQKVSPYHLSWCNDVAKSNNTKTGKMVTFTFLVADNAKDGTYDIKVDTKTAEIYDHNIKDVEFEFENGTVTVSSESLHTIGDCNWSLSKGLLTITGNGAMADMEDYEYHPETDTYTYNLPWGKEITKVVIEEGVTRIGVASFHYCKNLSSVELPSTLIEIGDKAFNGCSSVTNYTIPENVTSIGLSAFRGCTSLSSVTIGSNVKTIDDTAFYYCKNLKSVIIPKSVTRIGNMAFGFHSATKKYKDFTIYGYKGSAAETYAKENGFDFVSLEQTIKKGDVNLDGSVDIKDVTDIQSTLAEFKTLTDAQYEAADVDGNGDLTVSDATRLQMYLAEFDVLLG